MLLSPEEGVFASSPEESGHLQDAGYVPCYGSTRTRNGERLPCNYHLRPETQQSVLQNASGYYTCPRCAKSYDIMEDVPWHGASDEEADYNQRKFEQERYEPNGQQTFIPGGTTRIGMTLEQQAQIGEDLIAEQKALPGYGPITWWHEGGATAASPLDGATKDWGIEVKTIGYDATHHRFIPGREKEKVGKNEMAQKMGLKGILGVLVILNFRSSEADVYVKEMPLAPWKNGTGRQLEGVATFRSNTGEHLLEKLPFTNPYMDPLSGSPHAQSSDAQEDEVPF